MSTSSHTSSSSSGIDKKKLKTLLGKSHMIILDYYLLDGDCAMIKCFLARSFEFLLIYIPSKYRFPMEENPEKNIYEISVVEENTDCDDYAKTAKQPDIDPIEGEKSVNIYTELTRKYHSKNISLDDDEDEPIERKIKRQVTRLKIPFSNLRYDLAVQNGKAICVSFGEDLNIFNIKGYKARDLNMMYVMNLKDFIERVEEIQDQILIIKKQFYKIVEKVSTSNMDSIPSVDKRLNSKIADKLTSYKNYIEEYVELYDKAIQKEDEIVKKYKGLIAAEVTDNIKRNSIETIAHKELGGCLKTKTEIVEAGIKLVANLHKNILRWEQVGFDSLIMSEKIQRNFEMLEKYFAH
jgi:hypothetical protein